MLDIFIAEDEEKITKKLLVQRIFIGAPVCILFGSAWIASGIGGIGNSDNIEYRAEVVKDSVNFIALGFALAGVYLVYYGIKLVVVSVMRYRKQNS